MLNLLRTLVRLFLVDRAAWGAPRLHGKLLEPPGCGVIVEIPKVAGLHHRYTRRAA